MAPFKLKFRMGSSRSGSQETTTAGATDTTAIIEDSATPAQPLLLGGTAYQLSASNTTIDSDQFNDSLGSHVSHNDQRNLLPLDDINDNNTTSTGYVNPALSQTTLPEEEESNNIIPQSPPPSYEHVLEENRLANLDKDNNPTINIQQLSSSASVGGTSGGGSGVNGGVSFLNNKTLQLNDNSQNNNRGGDTIQPSSSSSSVFTFSTMTTPSQENLINNIGSSDPLYTEETTEQVDLIADPDEESEHNDDDNEIHNAEDEDCCSSMSETENHSDNDWDSHHDHQYQQQDATTPDDYTISNKSSKQIYKAVAKEWGITCKMSEQCRCMECQSNYFDCEYDENDHQKTDGGLGAGTPMFINDVMQGTACTIL